MDDNIPEMNADKNNSLRQSQIPSSVDKEIENLINILFPGGFTIRDEANAIVALAFRNGPIEKLHAGKNSELLKDETLSRITNEEMKEIMINASEHVARLLKLKETDPEEYYAQIFDFNRKYCRGWER